MIKNIKPICFFEMVNQVPKTNVSILVCPPNECQFSHFTQAQLEEALLKIDEEIKLTQITIKQLKKQLSKEDDSLVGYVENKRKAKEFLRIAKNRIDK